MKRTPPLALAVFVLALAVACGGGGGSSTPGAGGGAGGAASTNTWVGKLADSDAFIAIMKEGTAHLIYITNGKDISLWFKGNASGAVVGYFTFYNDEGGSIINNPAGDGFGGTVTIGPGKHHKYTTTPARGDAGLYRAKETTDGVTWESGWIVLNDGEVLGARRSGDGKIEGLATRGGTKWTNPAADP